MIDDKTELLKKIESLATEKWSSERKPLLLSNIGTKLSFQDIDYRTILDGAPIGKFISENSSVVKIVKHPLQRAKIAVVPASIDFQFEDIPTASPAEVSYDEEAYVRLRKSRGAFYSFIAELSKMSAAEIDSVVIPTRVIVKFLEGNK